VKSVPHPPSPRGMLVKTGFTGLNTRAIANHRAEIIVHYITS